jgi:dTDP-4-dehydrorhamnose reductase
MHGKRLDMRILLLGKNGQLGWELQRSLATLGNIISLDFPEIDFSKLKSLRQSILEICPQLIVNAVAYTAVDRAEKEPRLAMLVNGEAPGLLAEIAKIINAGLIHFSTDYVFDGKKKDPYTETDLPNPVQVYGQSKLQGEQNIEQAGFCYIIIRTSWMFSLRGENFLLKILRQLYNKSSLLVVGDQFGSPTSARMLAEAIAQVIAMGKRSIIDWIDIHKGIYHLAGEGIASRYEFAKMIIQYCPDISMHTFPDLICISADSLPTVANRPPNSALNTNKFYEEFGLRLPPWKAALHMTLDRDYFLPGKTNSDN